jgi:hypothetical protein
MRNSYRIVVGYWKRKAYLGDLGVGGKIILKWILKKWGGNWFDLVQDGCICRLL